MSKFSSVVSSFRSDSIRKAGEVRKAATIELFRGVIMDTPVDEGRARGNWQATTENPATGQLDIYDEDGRGTVAVATSVVTGSGDDQTLWLSNNLPYILGLEYGRSDQAPQGMVRRNMARVANNLRKHANQVK
ncbi:hypothetical protein GCM10023116_43640 [Kistimonas scapharcae]|uniref:HK97 gp10 family phage protein n=1 Tax=Kistimonas scapharcae TaxID=1036133 RepID=A0ABP8V7T8_9GAMM